MNSRALRITCGENTGLMLPQDEPTAKAPAPRLLVDAMLGRLVRWLRLLGYDAAYWRDGSDEDLIAAAQAEDRLIVTRDHALAGRRGVRALLIAAEGLDEQIAEARTALVGAPAPFTRCGACGGELTDLPYEAARDLGATLCVADPNTVQPLPPLRPGLLERYALARVAKAPGTGTIMIENSAASSDVIHPAVQKKDAGLRVRRDSIIALIIGLAGFVFYAATAAPSVATLFDDSLEFQVVLPTLGITHPSGYPLYTLLGKLFTLLIPFRDAAGRANLLSALCAGAALGVLYLLAQKVAGNRAAAATATALFALSPAWWSQATIAEVYALHGLFVVLFLNLLLRWEEARVQESGARGQGSGVRDQRSGVRGQGSGVSFQLQASSNRWLAAAALVFGLGMTHHRMIALMLPAALVLIFWTDPALIRQPRRWLVPLLCAFTPLLLYLYLPIRGQIVTSLDGTFAPTLAGTLDWVMARGYSIFLTGNPFGVERSASTVIALFLDQLGVLTIVAAIMGLVTAWKFSRRRYVFLLLATASQVAFASAYKVQDVEVFFLPAFMLTAVWAAWGLAPLFDGLALRGMNAARRLRPSPWLRSLIVFGSVVSLAVVMLFEPVRTTLAAFPEQNRRTSWGVYDLGADMVASVARRRPGDRSAGRDDAGALFPRRAGPATGR